MTTYLRDSNLSSLEPIRYWCIREGKVTDIGWVVLSYTVFTSPRLYKRE